MTQRACEKCGEMVSAAKAFCPSCGHALVEEETRAEASEFQNLDGTMKLGQTMYNEMLSEMGLNIAAPSEPGRSIKPVEPPQPDPARPRQPVKAEVLRPAVVETLAPAASPVRVPEKKDRNKLLLVIGGVIVALWVLLLVLIGFFAILPRLR
jgi:hypothetical protein